MKLIKLRGSYAIGENEFAKVDDEDYDFLMQFKWYTQTKKGDSTSYVYRSYWEDAKVKRETMHRDVMKAKKGQIVDHKDHNGVNNQKSNLRICTPSDNMRNRISAPNKSSKYLGVFAYIQNFILQDGSKSQYKRYKAVIRLNKDVQLRLGTFPFTEEGEIAAAKAYDVEAKKHHGEFANLNFKD